MTARISFDNSYARLPDRFYARVAPTPVRAPRLVKVNEGLARELGVDAEWLSSPEGVEVLSGNKVPEGAEPIAMAYAGHQFGNFVPQLGDGRAILLGEVVDGEGRRRDVQLKGPGPTPFSRRGDGRAALGPVLREYVVSEAMAALGLPTTRALAAVTTGQPVYRETPLPGAVLTRVAGSHVRVGTFEFFAARQDVEGLRVLADYVLARHYPDRAGAGERYKALLEGVVEAQAGLIARWMLVGFIHGVMNTDNMAVSGETIDFGPCAFMDVYDPETVFSSIDRGGRYAWGNQPYIGQWNLTRLAEALLPLLGETTEAAVPVAEEVLQSFAGRFEAAWQGGLRRKLGLATEQAGDAALGRDLLGAMAAGRVDFTNCFRALTRAAETGEDDGVRGLWDDPAAVQPWLTAWRQRLGEEPGEAGARVAMMRGANPVVIPRNHRVEEMIQAAVEREDFGPFHRLVEVLARPYEERAEWEEFTRPPEEHERVRATFCGT